MLTNITLLVLAALSLTLANPNELSVSGSLLLGFIALVPLFLLIARSKNSRHDILYGTLYAIIVNPLLYFWLSAFQNFSVWALLGIVIVYILYYIPLFILLGSTRHVPVHIKLPIQILTWTSFEFLKSIGPLGFPWGMLANTRSSNLALIQIADFMGMWGVSFVIATANVCIAHSIFSYATQNIRQRSLKYALNNQLPTFSITQKPRTPLHTQLLHHIPVLLLPVLITLLSLGYGLWRLSQPLQERSRFNVQLMQINTDPWESNNFIPALTNIQRLSQTSIEQNSKPDLLVWPETFLRFPYTSDFREFYQNTPTEQPFVSFLRDIDTPLLTGITDYEEKEFKHYFYNAMTLFTPDAKMHKTYRKQHLVPMGEFLPWWNTVLFRWFYQAILGLAPAWTPGERSTLIDFDFNGNPIYLGPLICFEDSFSDIARDMHHLGADVLINITNNSWAGVQSTLEQQFSAARYRSVETRLSLVRLGNNGLTQVIDPHGRVLAQAEPLTQATLHAEVPVYQQQTTFYTRFGNLIPWMLYGLCMLYVCLFPIQVKRRVQ